MILKSYLSLKTQQSHLVLLRKWYLMSPNSNAFWLFISFVMHFSFAELSFRSPFFNFSFFFLFANIPLKGNRRHTWHSNVLLLLNYNFLRHTYLKPSSTTWNTSKQLKIWKYAVECLLNIPCNPSPVTAIILPNWSTPLCSAAERLQWEFF